MEQTVKVLEIKKEDIVFIENYNNTFAICKLIKQLYGEFRDYKAIKFNGEIYKKVERVDYNFNDGVFIFDNKVAVDRCKFVDAVNVLALLTNRAGYDEDSIHDLFYLFDYQAEIFIKEDANIQDGSLVLVFFPSDATQLLPKYFAMIAPVTFEEVRKVAEIQIKITQDEDDWFEEVDSDGD